MKSNNSVFSLRFLYCRTTIQIGVIIVCLALLYGSIVKNLVLGWIQLSDFSHGFLVPLVSLYFMYEKRNQLSNLMLSGRWSGLGLIIVGILLLFLGNLATEYFTIRYSLIVVLGRGTL
jgi:hypothetical protein